MPTIPEAKEFIATLRYPKFATYVVNQLMKKYMLTRDEAVTVWEELRQLEAVCS